MSNATVTYGRFNPPTEEGHGRLISAVQSHAEKTGGEHYIFPSHTQDAKKNPLSHEDKVGFMRRMFPDANIVSNDKVRTALDAMKHLESKGHTHVTMVVGSDRVDEFHNLLNKYKEKEYPGIKKVSVVSAGDRDPDADGAEGMSASKLRGLVSDGRKDEFIKHYSDPKLGKEIHDKVLAGMVRQPKKKLKESIGIFLLGGPGSGKDYVLKNIFSRFDLMEVQIDQVLTGAARNLFEQGANVVINGGDAEKIQLVKMIYEDYTFDHVFVSVTNKVSRERNAGLKQPLNESKRIDKFLKAEKMMESFEDAFIFNNSINLNESSDMEKILFASQIEKLLERVVGLGLEIKEIPDPKVYTTIKEKVEPKKFSAVRHHKSGLPSKYVKGLTPSEIEAKKAHIEKNKGLSDKDPEAYKDMAGDKRIREKGIPQSQYTKAFHKKFGEQVELDEAASDKSLSAKAEKSGVSLATLRKVYNRGVAAWNSGHRPGTTPQQWGHARVNSYIMKGKTYHTADKDLHEAAEDPLPAVLPKQKHAPVKRGYKDVIDSQKRNLQIAKQSGLLPEMQLVGTDEYRQHAIAMTPGQDQEIEDVTANLGQNKVNDCGCSCGGNCGEDCGCSAANESCVCGNGGKAPRNFGEFRKAISEAKKEEVIQSTINPRPVLSTKKKESRTVRAGTGVGSTLNPVGPLGFPQMTSYSQLPVNEDNDPQAIYHEFCKFCCDHHGLEEAPTLNLHDDPEWTTQNGTFGHYTPSTNTINLSITGRHPMDIMRTLAHEITHAYQNSQSPLPPEAGETGSDWENHANAEAGVIMRKWRDAKPEAFKAMMESAGLEESIQYHLENNISFTENVFRPGSDNFFAMINTAKKLYSRGRYAPVDEYEQDLLESNIGEKAIYEGKEVILDFPFQEILNEEDETGGHGIGKPFRSHGGGAVYVKNSKGNVIKVNFSQSGMKKRYNEPKRVRSFIARHHCLTNKDRTSASYWACRWPRYFSDTGQQWW